MATEHLEFRVQPGETIKAEGRIVTLAQPDEISVEVEQHREGAGPSKPVATVKIKRVGEFH